MLSVDRPGPHRPTGPLLRDALPQAAHRDRRRAETAQAQSAWQRSRLSADIERLAALGAGAGRRRALSRRDRPGRRWRPVTEWESAVNEAGPRVGSSGHHDQRHRPRPPGRRRRPLARLSPWPGYVAPRPPPRWTTEPGRALPSA
ncbi:hypothetical protein ACFQX6_66245 [Streptosporangium lutulentum]